MGSEMYNVIRMNTGDGLTSYAKNSGLQRAVILRTLPMLNDTLVDMLNDAHIGSQKCYKLVDFGCSSGPNSVWAMSYIANTIENMWKEKNIDVLPAIEGYFSDLPDNDFNNLFRFLPSVHGNDQNGKEKGQRLMYGLPGSFYGRQFTEKTLHFAYSSYALHWLSQVPEGLGSENKENIFLAEESSPKVLEAYSNQFHRDFFTFIKLRGEEMIPGGRMVLSFIGRSDDNSYDHCAYLKLLATSLLDMVVEGIVQREDLHSFNVPEYFPCESEVRAIVEKEGSFTLDRFEGLDVPWDANNSSIDEWEDPLVENKSGIRVAHCIRAVFESMLTKHFKSSIIDDLFERYAKKVGEHMSLMRKSTYFTIVVSFRRK